MIQIPIFYASSEGQTARIAEQLAVLFRESGFSSAAIDVTSPRAAVFDWTPVKAVLVGASLHIGKHQEAAARFVRSHIQRLNAHPSAFFSVSLTAASKNPAEVETARRIARDFCVAAGWTPDRIVPVAGRLAYSKYGWLTRWMMRRIARKEVPSAVRGGAAQCGVTDGCDQPVPLRRAGPDSGSGSWCFRRA